MAKREYEAHSGDNLYKKLKSNDDDIDLGLLGLLGVGLGHHRSDVVELTPQKPSDKIECGECVTTLEIKYEVDENTKILNITITKCKAHALGYILQLLDDVLREDPDILLDKKGVSLSADKKKVVEDFKRLPPDGKKLFARLYTRKQGWIKVDELHYNEIIDLADAIQKLAASGFIDDDLQNPEQILKLLTLKELKAFANEKKIKLKGTKKEELVQQMLVNRFQTEIFNKAKENIGRCIQLGSNQREVFRELLDRYGWKELNSRGIYKHKDCPVKMMFAYYKPNHHENFYQTTTKEITTTTSAAAHSLSCPECRTKIMVSVILVNDDELTNQQEAGGGDKC